MKFNTITGQVARGDDYLPRPEITGEIQNKLDAGSNLLLVAPRRVGKTSIMMHLFDNPPENTIVIYYISQSVHNENEFYKGLFREITKRIGKIAKYKRTLTAGMKQVIKSIKAVGKNGIGLNHDAAIDYHNEVFILIKKLKVKEKLIILVDEFAETIENIAEKKDDGRQNAIHLLETFRALRQLPEAQKKIQFVFAGSIGLENIVESLACIKHINDITPVHISPLTKNKAAELSEKIIAGSGAEFGDGCLDYLFEAVEWLIPFYIQLILDETARILTENELKIITSTEISKAVNKVLTQSINFRHWEDRLTSIFKDADLVFIKSVLNTLSKNKHSTAAQITNIAAKNGLLDSYHNLLNVLKHDGYINNDEDPKIYRFNSPLLKEYWRRNVAN